MVRKRGSGACRAWKRARTVQTASVYLKRVCNQHVQQLESECSIYEHVQRIPDLTENAMCVPAWMSARRGRVQLRRKRTGRAAVCDFEQNEYNEVRLDQSFDI